MNNLNYDVSDHLYSELEYTAHQSSILTKINIAKRMILSGVDSKTIANITELNINEITNLKL